MALKVGELFASFNLDTSGLSGAISSAEKTLSNFGKGLAIGGAAMTTAITAPVVKAFKGIYDSGAGFEKQMSRVFAIRGLDETTTRPIVEGAYAGVDAMKALEDEAMRMAAQTKYNTEETGKAYEYMAMAGWEAESMLAGLAPIMNLAIASGNDLAAVSDIVTDAMSAFHLSAEKTSKLMDQFGNELDVNNVQYFSDVLAAAATKSNTNVELMGETFKYVSATAGEMGYDIRDIAVAIGLMANSGTKGSRAGTALNTLLTNMAKPTDNMAEAMEKLGVKLDDGEGNMLSFQQIMRNLRQGFSGLRISASELYAETEKLDAKLESGELTEEKYSDAVAELMDRAYGAEGALKAQTAAMLAGKWGMSGLLSIVGATDDDFESLIDSIYHSAGATDRMASIMKDNVAGAFAELESAVNVVETKLFKLEKGALTELIRKATDSVNAFGNMDESLQHGSLRLAGMAAAAGPVMAAVGGLIMALPKIAGAAAALTSPLGLVSMGFAALAAAAIDSENTMGKTLEAMGKKLNEETGKMVSDLESQKEPLKAGMEAILGSVAKAAEENLPGISSNVSSMVSTILGILSDEMPTIGVTARTLVSTFAQSIGESAAAILPSAITLGADVAEEVIKSIPAMIDAGLQLGSGVLEGFSNVEWESIGVDIHSAVETALGSLKDLLGKWLSGTGENAVGDAQSDWTVMGQHLVEKIYEGIKGAAIGGKDFLGGLLLGEGYEPDDDWADFGGKIIEKVFQGTEEAAATAEAFVSGILDGLASVFSDTNIAGASDALSGIVSRIITAATDEIPKLADHAGLILQKLGELIFGGNGEKGLTASAMEGAGELANAVFHALVDSLPRIEQAGESILSALANALTPENARNFTEEAEAFASNLLTAMANAIGGLGNTAVNLLTALGDAIFGEDENGASVVSAGVNALREIVGTILSKITSDVIPGLGKEASSIITALGDTLYSRNEDGKQLATEVLGTVTGIVQDIFSAIPGLIAGLGREFLSPIFDALTGIFTSDNMAAIGESWGEMGASIIDGIGDAIASVFDGAAELAAQTAEAYTGEETPIHAVSEGMKEFFSRIMDSVTKTLPKLIQSGGNLFEAFGKLAGGIVKGLADSLNGIGEEAGRIDFSADFAGMAQGIASGLISAVERLPDLLGGTLSVGAQVVNAIMSSVSRAFAEINESGIAGTLGEAATKLLNNLLGGVGDLKENPDVDAFMGNLSQALVHGMGALGDFSGKLVGYLFSQEGLRKLYDAGTTIVELILKGMSAGMSGVLNFVGSIADSILIQVGVIDPEARDAAQESGRKLAASIAAGVESELSDSIKGRDLLTLMQYALSQGGQGHQFDGTWSFLGDWTADLNTMLDTTGKTVEQFRDDFIDNWLDMYAFTGTSGFKEFWSTLFPEFKEMDTDSIISQIESMFGSYESVAEMLKDKFGADYFFPQGLDFWQAFYDAVSSGDSTQLMDVLSEQAIGLFGEAEKTIAEAEQREAEAINEAMDRLGETAAAAVEEAEQGITAAMQKGGNSLAKEGFATALADSEKTVDAAVLKVSDAAVKEFLLTMSAENGSQIGLEFVGGLISGMDSQGGGAASKSVEIGSNAVSSLGSAASSRNGYTIGSNFGVGFVNGISVWISTAADVARQLGAAAGNALSEAIQEGSPSHWTEKIGGNFGLGFINRIDAMKADAAEAAASMGKAAGNALMYSVRDISRIAADQTQFPQHSPGNNNLTSYPDNRSLDPLIERFTDSILNALEKVNLYMNGVEVGHLVAETVSEDIAHGAALKR